MAEVLPQNAPMLRVFDDAGFDDLAHVRRTASSRSCFDLRPPTPSSSTRVDRRDHVAVAASLRPFFAPRSVAVVGASARRGTIGGELFRNILAGGLHRRRLSRQPQRRARRRCRAATPRSPTSRRSSTSRSSACRATPSRRGRVGSRRGRQGALRHLGGIRRDGRRGRGAPGRAARARARARRAPHRAELPRHRVERVAPERDVRARARSRRTRRLLVPERRARARAARGGGRARARPLELRLDRQQGRCLVERPARVLGGRRRDRRRAALPRVVRQPAQVRAHREPRGPQQADPRDARAGRAAPARARRARTPPRSRARTRAVDALFWHAGVLRPRTLEELLDATALLSRQPLPHGSRVAVLTNAGGLGILCADACEAGVSTLPSLPTRRSTARRAAPAEASFANPVDMLGSATAETYEAVLPALLADPGIDAVIAIFVPPVVATRDDVAAAIERASAGASKPVLPVVMSADGTAGRRLRLSGVRRPRARPRGGTCGVAAPAGVDGAADRRNRPASAAARSPHGSQQARTCGSSRRTRARSSPPTGCRSSRSGSPRTRRGASKRPGSSAIPWSSRRPKQACTRRSRAACTSTSQRRRRRTRRVRRSAAPVVVQQFVTGGVELLAGAIQDPVFGPLVAFGPGGIYAELIGSARVAHRAARRRRRRGADHDRQGGPSRRRLARRAARRPRRARRPRAPPRPARGRPPEVVELDLNPVIARPDGCVAVDARIRLRRVAAGSSPKTW